jgi:hypothetical protein
MLSTMVHEKEIFPQFLDAIEAEKTSEVRIAWPLWRNHILLNHFFSNEE